MPNITMLDIEALRTTKLKPYIDKCLEHRAPDPGFHAMMGHNVDLCEAMFVAGRHRLRSLRRVDQAGVAAGAISRHHRCSESGTWRGMSYQTVLTPEDQKTGELIFPYTKAK